MPEIVSYSDTLYQLIEENEQYSLLKVLRIPPSYYLERLGFNSFGIQVCCGKVVSDLSQDIVLPISYDVFWQVEISKPHTESARLSIFSSDGLLGIRVADLKLNPDSSGQSFELSDMRLKFKLDDYFKWAGLFSVSLLFLIFIYCFLLSDMLKLKLINIWRIRVRSATLTNRKREASNV
jgi:hypothetical protein